MLYYNFRDALSYELDFNIDITISSQYKVKIQQAKKYAGLGLGSVVCI